MYECKCVYVPVCACVRECMCMCVCDVCDVCVYACDVREYVCMSCMCICDVCDVCDMCTYMMYVCTWRNMTYVA